MGKVVAMKKPDSLFFRVKDNGAAVFRVDTENRQRRLELQQIANVNTKTGEIKSQGDAILTAAETKSMQDWIAARQELNAQQQSDEIRQTIDTISLTAHLFQSRATDAEVDAFADDLLMAMHDLRSVIVRKKSERLEKSKKTK